MPNMDKVLKGLECCTKHECGKECPYHDIDTGCRTDMEIDALALLKEQEAEIDEISDEYLDLGKEMAKQPEIVLCKDCKYGYKLCEDYISCEISEENESGCHLSHRPEWYCADGVRKS